MSADVVPEPRHTAPAVHARGLVKRFGERVAVAGVDLDVRPGESFGVLGPNGAGKTSLMRMVGCVSPASAGTLRVLGRDPAREGAAIRARLGVVPQLDSLDVELSVRENLVLYARYFDIARDEAEQRARELLDFVQLSDRAEDQVEPLSGGMKRRLTIARALVNEPEMLLLDEPTTGLDPQARHLLWDRLRRLKRRGVTLVLTTHYMDEAEQLCDRLVVMDGGRIVAEGTPRELIGRWSTRDVVEVHLAARTVGDGGHADGRAAVAEAADLSALAPLAERLEVLADRVLLYTSDGDRTAAGVHASGLRPDGVLVRRSTLEDVFLRLTGRSLVD